MNGSQRDDDLPVRESCDLADLLGRAAVGDVAAFLDFYDRTSALTYRYALAGRRGDRVSAESLTRGLYLRAWRTADQQPESGLSPVAWLIAGAATVATSDAGRKDNAC